MKTTKKELSDIHKLANKLNFDDFCKAMQEYSDQQTANLKLINAKQAELINRFLKGNLQINPDDYSTYQRLNDELFALQSREKEPCDSCNADPRECKSCGSGTRSNKNADDYYETQ